MLIVVDVQNDFCPGGALPVDKGDQIIPRLNRVIDAFERSEFPLFFTRDWHPRDHISFEKQGGPWPPHCVQGTFGAEFRQDLRVPPNATVISKGKEPLVEAYSGFQGTGLETTLKDAGVTQVFIGGLATDYCVKETALDARRSGFSVAVIEDCVRPVDAKPGDGERALEEMRRAGAKLTSAAALIQQLASTQQ